MNIPTLDGIVWWCVGQRDQSDDLDEQPGKYAVKFTFDDVDQAGKWLKWIIANHPQYRPLP